MGNLIVMPICRTLGTEVISSHKLGGDRHYACDETDFSVLLDANINHGRECYRMLVGLYMLSRYGLTLSLSRYPKEI